MSEDGHGGEGMLESIERSMTLLREVPRSIFPGELGQGNHDVRVIKDKLAVKVCEAQEGLDILHLARFRPVTDSGYFVRGHRQTFQR